MKISLIYLLGAGRSGTTLLSTLLNNHSNIKTIGEMHQFYEHIQLHKNCSCGLKLEECSNWKNIIESLEIKKEEIHKIVEYLDQKESHSNILKLIFKKSPNKKYLSYQDKYFEPIIQESKKEWLLDSSKYIARYLLLKKSKKIRIKGIYAVRDVRGVVNSFGKKVQTQKSPLSAIAYYLTINFFGQLICWMDKGVIKIRYEDLTKNPEEVLSKIYNHIFDQDQNMISLPNKFEMPHIIGGNRMKSSSTISIKSDLKWKKSISRFRQIGYYLLSLPIMLLNKYKI